MAANLKEGTATCHVNVEPQEESGEWMVSFAATGAMPSGLSVEPRMITVRPAEVRDSNLTIEFEVKGDWEFFTPAVVWEVPPQPLDALFGKNPIEPSFGDARTCSMPLNVLATDRFAYVFYLVLRSLKDGKVKIADPTIISDPPPGQ
jgi:hypothetical protein